MIIYFYTASLGFGGPYEVGRDSARDFTTPDGVFRSVLGAPIPSESLYEATIINNLAPDTYYEPDDPRYDLAFVGTEFDPAARVERSNAWVSQSLDTIKTRKLDEGAQYADTVAFSSARTEANPNVYILTRMINVILYLVAGALYSDRAKDRTGGPDTGATPPPAPLDWATYWARDVPVRLVNATNGNLIQRNSSETEWGQVLKELGNHVLDTQVALDAYQSDVLAKYDAAVLSGTPADRDALANLDPEDQIYGWPPYYDGPANGDFSRVVRESDAEG